MYLLTLKNCIEIKNTIKIISISCRRLLYDFRIVQSCRYLPSHRNFSSSAAVSSEMTNSFRPPADRRTFPISPTSCFRFPFEKCIVNVCRRATERLCFLKFNYGLSKLVKFRTVGTHIGRPHKTAPRQRRVQNFHAGKFHASSFYGREGPGEGR